MTLQRTHIFLNVFENMRIARFGFSVHQNENEWKRLEREKKNRIEF